MWVYGIKLKEDLHSQVPIFREQNTCEVSKRLEENFKRRCIHKVPTHCI